MTCFMSWPRKERTSSRTAANAAHRVGWLILHARTLQDEIYNMRHTSPGFRVQLLRKLAQAAIKGGKRVLSPDVIGRFYAGCWRGWFWAVARIWLGDGVRYTANDFTIHQRPSHRGPNGFYYSSSYH